MARKATVASTPGSEKINHTFSDGTKFTGTLEQLHAVAKTLGLKLTGVGKTPRGYYESESKGLVKISELNDHHIRRALLKRSKDYFTEVYDRSDSISTFLKKYTNLTADTTIVDLYTELEKRK